MILVEVVLVAPQLGELGLLLLGYAVALGLLDGLPSGLLLEPLALQDLELLQLLGHLDQLLVLDGVGAVGELLEELEELRVAVLGVVRRLQHLDHAVRHLLRLVINILLLGFLDLDHRLLIQRDCLLGRLPEERLLVERDLHARVHPRLLEVHLLLLAPCRCCHLHRVCLRLRGSHLVPHIIHLQLHVGALL